MSSFPGGLLDKSRIVAAPGFNRWLVPPAALCIHLCIGMAYGFSVFWLPLTRAVGITHSVPCPETSLAARLVSTTCDWDKPLLGWMYTLFFLFLGSSAAVFGGWLERAGPRKAGVVSACCWCGGLVVAAAGIRWHQLWLVWLGAGVIGGIGLGIGYISPVSTLIRWFPDRRGLAAGLAIMGFGGGALVGSPLADRLMKLFAGPRSVGVWETFLVLAAGYFLFMLVGSFAYRVPPEGWMPPGWSPDAGRRTAVVARRSLTPGEACRTPQFWLLWWMLCLNVSAGIGVLGMASPMLQEIFGGRLWGEDLPFERLDAGGMARLSGIAAGFTGLLSLFNIAGRFFWSAVSDIWGRRRTYGVFFLLGAAAYVAVPLAGRAGGVALFCGLLCLIMTMYGGGFATIPAYLADLFGPQFVGAIHGRLLTAWSMAGVLGPVLLNSLNESQLRAGVPRASAYDLPLGLMAGLLAIGFVLNLLVRPLPEVALAGAAAEPAVAAADPHRPGGAAEPGQRNDGWLVAGLWILVATPLAWGVFVTLVQAAALFG
jgi:MFS family permease